MMAFGMVKKYENKTERDVQVRGLIDEVYARS